MEKNFFDIAVVGESMSGKSTWIANLYSEEITEKLTAIFQRNNEGQTKIATHYILVEDETAKLVVSDIGWNREVLEENRQKQQKAALKILSDFFEIQESDEMTEVLCSNVCKDKLKNMEPENVLEIIINSEAVSESGIISFIELTGGASKEACQILRRYKTNRICIRDTRGFLDETEDKMVSFLKHSKKEQNENKEYENPEFSVEWKEEDYIQKLLDDRGICGIDACVFMSIANANALNKKNVKGIYGPLIRELLMKYPTFLVLRDTSFTKEMAKEENKTYTEVCDVVLSDEFFSGFDSIRDLLNEFGLNEHSSDYKVEIAHKHYKELLLANIAQKRLDEDGYIYRKSAVGVLDEAIKGIVKYYEDIDEATKCINKIMGNHSDIMKAIFDEYFDGEMRDLQCRYYNNLYRYLPNYLAGKIQGVYYGGLVGARGGLTTPKVGGGHVGDAAIDLMETAYDIKEYIYGKLVDSLTSEIEDYCRTVLPEDADINIAVSGMKKKIIEKMQHELDTNFERLSITGRMIPRKYLLCAYQTTREDLEIDEKCIGKYLKELESRFPEQEWERERCNVSALKYITWQLIRESFS